MISGSLLFLGNTRGQSIEKIYKKYIFKIVVLIAFWSCIYFVFRIMNGNLKITSLKSVFGELLFGNYHLWYLWMIAGLYAVTPILNKIVEDNRLCRYFLILCATVCWGPGMLEVVPALNKLVQGVLQDKMYLFLPAGYVGYYILGYYLCKNRLTDKQKNTILVAGIFGAAYATIGGILYSQYTGEPSQARKNGSGSVQHSIVPVQKRIEHIMQLRLPKAPVLSSSLFFHVFFSYSFTFPPHIFCSWHLEQLARSDYPLL